MKKLLLSLAAIASLSAANAQKMGDVFVNGMISFNGSTSDDSRAGSTTNGSVSNRFALTPSVGYQFDRNWGAGLMVDYRINRTTTPSTTGADVKETGRTIGVGPFLRYTRHLSPMFFLYGQLNAMYVNGRTSNDALGTTTVTGKSNGVNLDVMPAVGINITRHIAITGSFGRVGFNTLKNESPTNSSVYTRTNSFEATFGHEIMFGVQWNFSGGRMHRTRREPMGETRNMDRYRDDSNNNDGGDSNNNNEDAPRRRRRDRD